MKKPLLLLCLIASMLTINSCNSTDDNDGPPTTKEALEKKLQGRWERYKIVNIFTQQELSVEEYDFNSLFFLDFGTLNTIFFKWDTGIYNEEYPIDSGRYTIWTPGSFYINPNDSKEEEEIQYIIMEITNNKLVLYRNGNKRGAAEHFKRVK